MSSPRIEPDRRRGDPDAPPDLRLGIAGATGFVGRALVAAFAGRMRLVGLTRSAAVAERQDPSDPVAWRHCDLFSLREVEDALAGVDVAVYLVHSMEPSARLTQGSFQDLDLILADNFTRAAERCGVKQIVYLGGLIPDERPLSPHLASRLEVEETLASRGVPLTALRAGLVVGAGGSSLEILLHLVRRLPAMVLPRWTRSRAQPIALRDVVRAFEAVIGRAAHFGKAYDIGGPDVVSYREMLERSAAALGRHRAILPVPWLSPSLSRLWISLVAGAPRALVGPLIESLRHDMVCRDNALLRALRPDALGFDAALAESLARTSAPGPSPRADTESRRALRRARTVRSVQRLPLPPGRDARFVAAEYPRFLQGFARPLLRCEPGPEGGVDILLARPHLRLLRLRPAHGRSTPDLAVFQITGGVLLGGGAGLRGRLEFRETPDRRSVLAAVHDFTPALPWPLYQATQARLHQHVMRAFGRHLGRLAAHEAPASPPGVAPSRLREPPRFAGAASSTRAPRAPVAPRAASVRRAP